MVISLSGLEGQPKYKHDCGSLGKCCIFIGHKNNADYYTYASNSKRAGILKRSSDEPSDYKTMPFSLLVAFNYINF